MQKTMQKEMHKALHETLHEEIPAEWREFSAGMEFLRRYGSHNTANENAIGRDNLRLLHRSLLQKADYRHQLHQAGREMQHTARPNKTTLIASNQLSAQLIGLPAESSIQLIVRTGERAMFMILAGSARTSGQPATHTRSRWWPQSWLPSQPADVRSHALKADDIICITHGQPNPSVLSTHKKTCIVLAVFTSQANAQSPLQQQPAHTTNPLTEYSLAHHSSL